MTNCPVCQSPIKTVPAGISKKNGQPYQAFQACSNRQCTWKPEKTPNVQAASNASAGKMVELLDQMLRSLLRIEVILANPSKVHTAQAELKPDEDVPF